MAENNETSVDPIESTPSSDSAATVTVEPTAQTPAATEPAPRPVGRTGPAPNVEMTGPVLSGKVKGPVTDDNSLSFICADGNELDEISAHYRQMQKDRSEPASKWMSSIGDARRHMMDGEMFSTNVRDPDALWRQAITATGGEQLRAGVPSIGEGTNGERIAGPQAITKIKGLLGMGTIVRIPLWHSGLWVNIKAPSEVDLLELERRIANEKVSLGRSTQGMAFSNAGVYIHSYLLDFALAHVYEATYRQVPALELRSKILSTDLMQLVWGLVCAIYPNGHNYRQPCVTDPAVCKHVVEDRIDLRKLSWVNDRALTEAQRRLMSDRTGKFTDEQLEAYRNDHEHNRKYGTVDLHPNLKMVLRVPTLEEHVRSGMQWVDGIVEKVDTAFGSSVSAKERNILIGEHGQAQALRQYAQWIEKLVLDDGQQTIVDRATIEDVLGDLTSHQDVYKNFFEGVQRYIEASTISLIAVPKYNCPACGKPMSPEENKHPHLIPVDIDNIFFTLLDQRIQQILEPQQG